VHLPRGFEDLVEQFRSVHREGGYGPDQRQEADHAAAGYERGVDGKDPWLPLPSSMWKGLLDNASRRQQMLVDELIEARQASTHSKKETEARSEQQAQLRLDMAKAQTELEHLRKAVEEQTASSKKLAEERDHLLRENGQLSLLCERLEKEKDTDATAKLQQQRMDDQHAAAIKAAVTSAEIEWKTRAEEAQKRYETELEKEREIATLHRERADGLQSMLDERIKDLTRQLNDARKSAKEQEDYYRQQLTDQGANSQQTQQRLINQHAQKVEDLLNLLHAAKNEAHMNLKDRDQLERTIQKLEHQLHEEGERSQEREAAHVEEVDRLNCTIRELQGDLEEKSHRLAELSRWEAEYGALLDSREATQQQLDEIKQKAIKLLRG